jgi:hypothetical protein
VEKSCGNVILMQNGKIPRLQNLLRQIFPLGMTQFRIGAITSLRIANGSKELLPDASKSKPGF